MLRLLIIFGSGFDVNLFEEWPKINGLRLDIIGRIEKEMYVNIKNVLMICVVILGICSTSEASKLDPYRQMIEENNFVIKYEIDDGRDIEKEKEFAAHRDYKDEADPIEIMQRDYGNLPYKPQQGIIAVNGLNKYTETSGLYWEKYYGNKKYDYKLFDRHLCFLKRADKKYYFSATRYRGENKKDFGKFYYWGATSGNQGGSRNKIEEGKHLCKAETSLMQEMNYGSLPVGTIIAAISPKIQDEVTEKIYIYDAAGTGTLDDGVTYEDYLAKDNGAVHAMRFEFKDDSLIRVKYVAFAQNSDGTIDKSTYLARTVNIIEFSSPADSSYFSLPETLKIVTQGKK